jgi:hypothetical protein
VYVINTCSITAEADADSRRLARQAIRRNPSALVAVTGCYAQAAPQAVAAIPGVDLVLGNGEKADLFTTLAGSGKNGGARVLVGDVAGRRLLDEYGLGIDSIGRERSSRFRTAAIIIAASASFRRSAARTGASHPIASSKRSGACTPRAS